MIFECLMTAVNRRELILSHGGLCRFHHRRDNLVTINEILVLPDMRGKGLGRALIAEVMAKCPEAIALTAKCPVDLPSNDFWRHLGFKVVGLEYSSTGRGINLWRLDLD